MPACGHDPNHGAPPDHTCRVPRATCGHPLSAPGDQDEGAGEVLLPPRARGHFVDKADARFLSAGSWSPEKEVGSHAAPSCSSAHGSVDSRSSRRETEPGVKDTRPLGGDERQAACPLSAPLITDRASHLQGLRDTPIADRMGKGRETCVRS